MRHHILIRDSHLFSLIPFSILRRLLEACADCLGLPTGDGRSRRPSDVSNLARNESLASGRPVCQFCRSRRNSAGSMSSASSVGPVESAGEAFPGIGIEQRGRIRLPAMDGRARPRVFVGEPADAGADRVALNVTQGQQAVVIVHGIGVKAILPEMSAALVKAIDKLGVEPVRSSDGFGERIGREGMRMR